MQDEKKLKEDFYDLVPDFGKMLGCDSMLVYCMEFPTHTGDKTLYADMLLENDIHDCPMDNDLFILEFKDKEILHSALDQLNLYCDIVPKQLYRKGLTTGILVSSKGFSEWELVEAKKQGRLCVLFDGQNIRLV